jgi:hypothetical protein
MEYVHAMSNEHSVMLSAVQLLDVGGNDVVFFHPINGKNAMTME